MESSERRFPMLVLLLSRIRRVSVLEASKVIAAEIGQEAAATVREIGTNAAGMSYLGWMVGPTPYHLGSSSEPYLPVVGVGKVNDEGRITDMKWTMREEVPPEDADHCNAWMAHTAWMYVDALLFHSQPEDDPRHLRNVLRIASHFIDEHCLLAWLCGKEPKQVVLPTQAARAALREGKWPA